ncbi:MAG: argininosuccinate synthase [Dehalococcoidia bacterium]
MPKLVLAYSGGLDTTTAIKWLSIEKGYEVIALNIDVGMSREQPVVESRGMAHRRPQGPRHRCPRTSSATCVSRPRRQAPSTRTPWPPRSPAP